MNRNKLVFPILLFFLCCVGFVGCDANSQSAVPESHRTQTYFPVIWETDNPPEPHLEIVQFHHEDKCDTCTLLQNVIQEVMSTDFSQEISDGVLVYHSVETNYAENKSIKQTFHVMEEDLCSSIYNHGEYTSIQRWVDIFQLAENDPDHLSAAVKTKIKEQLSVLASKKEK